MLKWTLENGKTSNTILLFSCSLNENSPVDPWMTSLNSTDLFICEFFSVNILEDCGDWAKTKDKKKKKNLPDEPQSLETLKN